MVIPTLKTCYFEASEDIMTKFKSQALHIIRIKYWKASGSGNPPSLIPALRKIAIYVLKMEFSLLFCTRLYISINYDHCQQKAAKEINSYFIRPLSHAHSEIRGLMKVNIVFIGQNADKFVSIEGLADFWS